MRADGAEAELWRIVLLRWLPAAAIGAIPFVSIFALHDYLADTVVVDAK